MRAIERSLAQEMAVNGNGLGDVPMWLRGLWGRFLALSALRFADFSNALRCPFDCAQRFGLRLQARRRASLRREE